MILKKKIGGGDGNRTHVRITADRKRYMLSSYLIRFQQLKNKNAGKGRLVYSTSYEPTEPNLAVLSFLLYELELTDRHENLTRVTEVVTLTRKLLQNREK